MSTVFKWLRDYPKFSEQYARAKEVQVEAFAEDLIAISDDGENDTYEVKIGDTGETVKKTDHDVIARSKLRVDTRKWLMSKMLPKKYGDRLGLDHSGSIITSLTDEELNAKLSALTRVDG